MKWMLLALAACATEQPSPHAAAWIADTSTFTPGRPPSPIADQYRGTAEKIIAAAHGDRDAFAKLRQLTDHVGNRLSGTPALEKAIAWAAQTMKADGHDVRTDQVMVPHWQRGLEEAEIISPIQRKLHVLGLGGSVSGNVTAPVVVVHDWAELDAKQASVRGAIVVYDVAMPKYTDEKGSGYGETVDYRVHGAARAAKYGAVASLMRSVTAHSLRTPHAGAQNYEDNVTKIPTAAITVEDALLVDRLSTEGPVMLRVHLEDQMLPDAPSANVIGEIRGREHPEEIVVIGGHLDSWDVGQGAHDDGAGVAICMQALTELRRLGLTPRRTIRAVLFTNEENGLAGGKAYAKDHAAELASTVAALETDSGGFAPRGFSIDAKDPAVATRAKSRVAEIASLLAPLHATRVALHGHGADVSPMAPGGVLVGSLDVDGRAYFDYHHTDADTLDKVDPATLADDVAAMAVMAYVLADLPERIDR
jgi:Zn-dependent M28 family amino/carboxypeptidase